MTPFEEAVRRVRAGASPEDEARKIVSEMTLPEKLDSLDGDLPFWPGLMDMMSGGYWEVLPGDDRRPGKRWKFERFIDREHEGL